MSHDTEEQQEEDQAPALRGFERKYLRGLAHSLRPAVQVGKAGVTEEVIREIKRALLDHELIKVSMTKPEDKKGMSAELAVRSEAHLCGLLGHTAVLYRAREEKPKIRLPKRLQQDS